MIRSWLKARFQLEHEIEDILQEALYRVLYASLDEEIRAPKAYLFTTARNVALMRLRKSKLRNEINLEDFACSSIIDDRKGTVDQLCNNENIKILDDAIKSLPSKCRKIIVLKKVKGMSINSIAKQLGISPNTVRVQVTIGLKKIRAYFEFIHGDSTLLERKNEHGE